MKPNHKLLQFLSIAGSSLLAISSTNAGDLFWAANGTSQGGAGTWDTTNTLWGALAAGPYGSIWDNANNDTAIFGSTAGAISLGTDITAGGLTFNTNGYSISAGNTLTLAGASAPIINVTTGTTTINSIIAGTDGLRKNGTGTLTLINTSNSFAGGITINGGGINVSDDAQLGDSTNGIRFTSTGQLQATVNNVALAASRTITVDSGANAIMGDSNVNANPLNFTVNGRITGLGGVQVGHYQLGSGQTFLNSTSNDFSGALRLGTSDDRTYSYGNFTLNIASLADGVGHGNIIFGRGNNSAANTATFAWSNTATSSLVLDHRRIELDTTVEQSVLANNNSNSSTTVTVNTDLLVSRAGNKTFGLGGSNTGENTFNGLIADSAIPASTISLTKSGGGRWIIGNDANTYTGITTVSAGTLQVSKLDDGGESSSIGASSSAAANLVFNNTGSLRYVGGGDTTDRQFTYNSTANNSGWSIDASGTGAINFENTGTITYTGTAGQNRTFTLTGTNTDNNTMAATIDNNGAGVVNLIKSGIGTWVITGNNGFTGTTTINGGGTLVLDYGSGQDNSKLSNTAALTIGAGAGNIVLRGGAHTEVIGSITSGAANSNVGGHTSITRDSGSATIALGAITRNQNTYNTISIGGDDIATTTSTNVNGMLGGGITVGSNWAKNDGSGNIVALTAGDYTSLTSSGTLTNTTNYQLTGSLTRSANTTLNSLRIVGDDNDQTLNMSSFNLNPSMLANAGAAIKDANKYGGDSATGGILYAGGGNNNYTITGTGNLSAQNGGQELIINTFQGTLNVDMVLAMGANGLTKSGEGTLVLSKAGTYTGRTHINQGTIRLTDAAGAGTTGNMIVHNGAALELTNDINVGTKATNIIGTGVSNGGALRNLSGDNSYAGVITIGAGGARINSVSGTMTVTGGVATSLFNDVTFGGAGDTTVSTTAISGSGNLIKDGDGTLTLSATNTYTGATLVSAGTLLINGNSSLATGNVTVNSGATLGGNGTVGGATTVSGNLNPGNSPGVLSFANSLELTASSTTTFEINGLVRGTEYDGIDVGTTLELGGALIFDFGTILGSATTFNLFDVVGSTTGNFASVSLQGLMGTGSFSFDSSDLWSLTDGDNTWTFSQSSGDLNFSVIPEPSTALLGGLGLLALLLRRR